MFANRWDAGRRLADRLLQDSRIRQTPHDRRLIVSIPRGGTLIGQPLAQALGCAHDVIIVKKIGFPGQDEYAIGAAAEDGAVTLNPDVLERYHLSDAELAPQIAAARARIAHYVQRFRADQPLAVGGMLTIVTDDGIATGETMRAAIHWLRERPPLAAPACIYIAVPVCSPESADELAPLVDAFVSLAAPLNFMAVGQFYWHFPQVSDEEVWAALHGETSV
jgi:predicted phosphoribosyltransferase